MQFSFKKRLIVIAIVLFVVGVGLFYVLNNKRGQTPATELTPKEDLVSNPKIIGASVKGRTIEAYTYGKGEEHLLFVGGMHGGYEWNSVLLAYQFMDYLVQNPAVIPANVTVTVIPSLNPDGVYTVTGKVGRFIIADVPLKDSAVLASGRFNARSVDLNRNFDCKWKPTSTWKTKTVSAGTGAFSEPEAGALRNFVLENKLSAVIFWHSQANAVYASECEAGILPETLTIMNAYSRASGYPAVASFDQYEISGDAEGWLASINIPALTVELKTHETIEWEQNLAGIKSLFLYYSKK